MDGQKVIPIYSPNFVLQGQGDKNQIEKWNLKPIELNFPEINQLIEHTW